MSFLRQFIKSQNLQHMKSVLQILFLLFISFTVFAQKNITVQINHLLNEEPFELEKDAQNNLGNKFMIDRLEYYLCSFSIVHDGGQTIIIDDSYVLVGMGDEPGQVEPTTID